MKIEDGSRESTDTERSTIFRWRPMKKAPKSGESFVVATISCAHNAEYDHDYQNFWSITAERALNPEECIGWMSKTEWHAIVTGRSLTAP